MIEISGKRPKLAAMMTFAIIHNYESDRLSYLWPKLHQITEKLDFPTTITESSSYTFIHPTVLDLRIRTARLIIARIRTNIHIRRNSKNQFYGKQIKEFWKIIINTNVNKVKANAELDVVAKHVSSWNHFIDSNADYLVVLESDAIVADEKQLQIFLARLETFEKVDFISLAWPFSNTELGITEDAVHNYSTFFTISFQITNTCAGYVLSRNLAQKLLIRAKRGKLERKIPIDWFMNRCFIDIQQREHLNAKTIVPNPQLVLNGSITGEYESQIQ
jgi:hypothetical protein